MIDEYEKRALTRAITGLAKVERILRAVSPAARAVELVERIERHMLDDLVEQKQKK